MVVFTCNHCGDSVQKPKVVKHYETKCRNRNPDLCCVDCLKDFRGEDHVAHTKCVSEAERYGGKNFVAKPSQNKNAKIQDAWVEVVQSVLDENTNLSGQLRALLERVSRQPNTPRKRAKFFNFVKSMDRRTSPADIEAAWNLLEPKLSVAKQTARGNTADLRSNVENSKNESNIPTENGEHENLDNSEEKSQKKKSKSKKNKDRVESPDKDADRNVEESTISSDKLNGNGDVLPESDDTELSKKERKEKRKREKYEMQLARVAQETKQIENDRDESADLASEAKKSKKQKRKAEAVDSVAIDENAETGRAVLKKSKKRKLEKDTEPANENGDNADEEPSSKRIKTPEEFDWTNAIMSVLTKKNKDISLKKLEKKVLTEYCGVFNLTQVTERINKKFTKSLKRIDNVKIVGENVCLS